MKFKPLILAASTFLLLAGCSQNNEPLPSSESSAPSESIASGDPLEFLANGKIRIDFVKQEGATFDDAAFTYGGQAITSGSVVDLNTTKLAFTGSTTVVYSFYMCIALNTSTGYEYEYSANKGAEPDQLNEFIAVAVNADLPTSGDKKVYLAITNKSSGGWTHGLNSILDQEFTNRDVMTSE